MGRYFGRVQQENADMEKEGYCECLPERPPKQIYEELNSLEQYLKKAVCNEIDSIMRKVKQLYVAYQKKGETGKEYTQEEIDFDIEVVELVWPNWKHFYSF